VFARKLVRLAGRVSKADIKNEAEVVSSICKSGGHKNIIEIIEHGWLKGSVNVYFIDMELGDFTLADYIDYHNSEANPSINLDVWQVSMPVVILRGCSPNQRVQNMWGIASHIVGGLEFLHMHNHVHRDLKPSNGVSLFMGVQNNNMTVLYCSRIKLWKLTDFGLTTEATSKVGRPTLNSRGTPRYRAPELLRDNAVFNNKVDIWALGCLLHELATLEPTFQSDWEIRERYATEIVLDISVPASTEFLRHHIRENIQELLHGNSEQRPRASDLRGIFRAYCLVLDLSIAETLLQSVSYPTYEEWKHLVGVVWKQAMENHFLSFESEILYQLVLLYRNKGEQEICIVLLEEMVRKSENERELRRLLRLVHEAEIDQGEIGVSVLKRLGDTLMGKRKYEDAITLYAAAVKQDRNRFSLRPCLAEAYRAKGDDAEAVRVYQEAIHEHPKSFWLSLNLSHLYLANNDHDGAVDVFERGVTQLKSIKSRRMAWSSFWAVAGDYGRAISIYKEDLKYDSDACHALASGLDELLEPLKSLDLKKGPWDDLEYVLSRYISHFSLFIMTVACICQLRRPI